MLFRSSHMTVKASKVHSDKLGRNVSLELIESRSDRVERSISYQEYKVFSDYTNSQLNELIADIDKNVFDYLLENIKIRTRIDSIEPGSDHDIVNVRVGVDFDHILLANIGKLIHSIGREITNTLPV